MVVIRFQIQARPERVDELAAALERVIAPSRGVEGCVHYDVGRSLDDPCRFVICEVFEDRAALERQKALGAVAELSALLPGLIAADPVATRYEVSSHTERRVGSPRA